MMHRDHESARNWEDDGIWEQIVLCLSAGCKFVYERHKLNWRLDLPDIFDLLLLIMTGTSPVALWHEALYKPNISKKPEWSLETLHLLEPRKNRYIFLELETLRIPCSLFFQLAWPTFLFLISMDVNIGGYDSLFAKYKRKKNLHCRINSFFPPSIWFLSVPVL